MSPNLLTKFPISILKCRIDANMPKYVFIGFTFIKKKSFHSHYFRTNVNLSQSTSFIAMKRDSLPSLTYYRQMAGHAKWQNVKHVKEAKDRQKNLVCNKYAFLIRTAIRDGGADIKLNHKLAVLIEQAKKNNVPNSVMENALKKDNNKKLQAGTIEILGPGGCIVVLEYETDNVGTMRHEIKNVCKKYGANVLSGEGRWRAVYEKKGIIKAINQKDGQPLDAEKALDSAIEAGAEEVHTRDYEDEKPFLEFLCAPDDLHSVKKEIEKLYEVEEGYVGYMPLNKLQVDKETSVLVDGLLNDLGSMVDVIRIFENVE